jgi:hypothetical protein
VLSDAESLSVSALDPSDQWTVNCLVITTPALSGILLYRSDSMTSDLSVGRL